MYAAAVVLRLVGQFTLFAGDHVVDRPRGKYDVERQCTTERENNGLAKSFHEQTPFPIIRRPTFACAEAWLFPLAFLHDRNAGRLCKWKKGNKKNRNSKE